MCLLVVSFQQHPDRPLVLGANRDELHARPATPMGVLAPGPPRIVGGRDALAGGTWLAVNEHGVVAGLTNLPALGQSPGRRSRGALPLALTAHRSARAAVEDFVLRFPPSDYNPCWLLVGDREGLYYVDMTGGAQARVEPLGPGLHVLENRPLGVPSPKVDAVRGALEGLSSLDGEDAVVERLHATLRSHEVPPGARPGAEVTLSPEERHRPPETLAPCVHAGPYGTRSSTWVVVPRAPRPPDVWFTEGPPCTSARRAAHDLWT